MGEADGLEVGAMVGEADGELVGALEKGSPLVETHPLSVQTQSVPPPFSTVSTLMYSKPSALASQGELGAAYRSPPRKKPMPPVDPRSMAVAPAAPVVETLVEEALATRPDAVTPPVIMIRRNYSIYIPVLITTF